MLKQDLNSAAQQLEVINVQDGHYPADVSDIKHSDGTDFHYHQQGDGYCLTATNEGLAGKAFHTTNGSSVEDGACDGDAVPGEAAHVPQQVAKLTPDDGLTTKGFGASVAISGSTAVIGAPDGGAGKVYVYVRQGDSWVLQAHLTPGNSQATDEFGASVAIEGDTIVVGAPSHTTSLNKDGAAYIFTRMGSAWMQTSQFSSPVPRSGGRFGAAVAISSGTIAVGQPGGALVYVYVNSGGAWSQQAALAPGATQSDGVIYFGSAVDIRGDVIAVGAKSSCFGSGSIPCYETDAGTGYIYDRSGTVWVRRGEYPNFSPHGYMYGYNVAVGPDSVAFAYGGYSAGEIFETRTASGASYIASHDSSQPLWGRDPIGENAVAFYGNDIIAGSLDAGNAVGLFRVDATHHATLTATLRPNDTGGASVRFGAAIDSDDSDIIMSAPNAAYIFK